MVAECRALHGVTVNRRLVCVSTSHSFPSPCLALLLRFCATPASMAAEALSETFRALADRIDLYTLHTPGVTDLSGLLNEDVQVRPQNSVPDSPVARNGTRIRLTGVALRTICGRAAPPVRFAVRIVVEAPAGWAREPRVSPAVEFDGD